MTHVCFFSLQPEAFRNKKKKPNKLIINFIHGIYYIFCYFFLWPQSFFFFFFFFFTGIGAVDDSLTPASNICASVEFFFYLIFLPFWTPGGCTMVVREKFSPSVFWKECHEYGVTASFCKKKIIIKQIINFFILPWGEKSPAITCTKKCKKKKKKNWNILNREHFKRLVNNTDNAPIERERERCQNCQFKLQKKKKINQQRLRIYVQKPKKKTLVSCGRISVIYLRVRLIGGTNYAVSVVHYFFML